MKYLTIAAVDIGDQMLAAMDSSLSGRGLSESYGTEGFANEFISSVLFLIELFNKTKKSKYLAGAKKLVDGLANALPKDFINYSFSNGYMVIVYLLIQLHKADDSKTTLTRL